MLFSPKGIDYSQGVVDRLPHNIDNIEAQSDNPIELVRQGVSTATYFDTTNPKDIFETGILYVRIKSILKTKLLNQTARYVNKKSSVLKTCT